MCQDENVKKFTEVADDLPEPLYKGKADVRSYGNHRSVKLLEHDMKVIERIFAKQLKNKINLDELQTGFMLGRGSVDAIFIASTVGKYDTPERKLYIAFVDLEKAFDGVPSKVTWWALRRKRGLEKEVLAISIRILQCL